MKFMDMIRQHLAAKFDLRVREVYSADPYRRTIVIRYPLSDGIEQFRTLPIVPKAHSVYPFMWRHNPRPDSELRAFAFRVDQTHSDARRNVGEVRISVRYQWVNTVPKKTQ